MVVMGVCVPGGAKVCLNMHFTRIFHGSGLCGLWTSLLYSCALHDHSFGVGVGWQDCLGGCQDSRGQGATAEPQNCYSLEQAPLSGDFVAQLFCQWQVPNCAEAVQGRLLADTSAASIEVWKLQTLTWQACGCWCCSCQRPSRCKSQWLLFVARCIWGFCVDRAVMACVLICQRCVLFLSGFLLAG